MTFSSPLALPAYSLTSVSRDSPASSAAHLPAAAASLSEKGMAVQGSSTAV